jgi:hypothetical protein
MLRQPSLLYVVLVNVAFLLAVRSLTYGKGKRKLGLRIAIGAVVFVVLAFLSLVFF